MKRFLLILVAAVVIGFAFVQYKITSSVSDGLENLQQTIAPFVRMEYGDVSSTLTGTVEVTDIRFVSLQNNQEIVVDKVALNAGNAWVLMNLRNNLQQNKIPDRLEFAIEGLAADMELMTNLQNTAVTDSPYTRLETAGCNGLSRFSRKELSAMGIDHLAVDMTTGYELSEGGTQLRFTNRMVFRELMAVNLEMVISHPAPINDVGLSAELANSSSLSSASIALEDRGQLARAQKWCAEESGMSTAQYRKHHLEAWEAEWRKMGLKPSESLVNAYRDYVENPENTLTVDIEPFPALNLGDNYLSNDPIYLSGRLNPHVSTDNTVMKPVSLSLVQSETTIGSQEKTVEPEDPTANSEQTLSADRAPSKAQAPAPEIDTYIQRNVAIALNNGRRIEGIVQAIEGKTLTLKRHLHGGTMIVPVQLQDIKTISPR